MTIRAVRVLVLMVVAVCCVPRARCETPRVEKVLEVPAGLVSLPVLVGGRVSTLYSAEGQGFGMEEYVSQWPGAYFETAFVGRAIYFRVGKSHEILHVVVDGGVPVVVSSESGAYKVAGLAEGRHTVSVQVATESQDGPVSFGGFAVAAGGKAAPIAKRSRQMEFIGDSHTVGYGNISTTQACSTEDVWKTTDDTRAFGRLIATHYGADYQVNAISGRGVVRNYNGFAADKLPDAYPYVLFDKKREYADPKWKPEVIVIALGTNDFSTSLNAGEKWKTREELHADYEKTYVGFIQRLRAKVPGAYIILWATDMAGGEIEAEVKKVVEQAEAAGETRIGFVPMDHLAFTGCHSHPSVVDDETISRRLEEFIDGQVGIWRR